MSLIVDHLDKDYATRSGPLPILRDVCLRLERGESLAVVGPSGSGKSTLLHILGTLEQPTRGIVTLEGGNPFILPERELAEFRNRKIGFVFQDHHLLPQCTVLENVLLPTLVNKDSHREIAEREARTLLEKAGLSSRIEHYPAELSGGERQRVAVARSLILKPALVLADEPTGNLDRNNAQAIGELLLQLHRQERTILIVVTHSADLARLFPRTMEMADGALR